MTDSSSTDSGSPSARAAYGTRVRPVPAVTRAIAILRLLTQTREPLSAKQVAQALHIVPSTALHILRALVAEDVITVDAAKRYRPGAGMLALARGMLEHNSFRTVVQPALDQLSRTWQVTAIGVETPSLDQMVVLALARSPLPFSLHVDVGSRFPGLISATGRLVAAYSNEPWDAIAQRFRQLRWQHPIDIDTWRKELETVRAQGYSVDRGGYIGGITIVAVPIIDSTGRLTHTIVCAGVSNTMDGAQADALIADMQARAAEVASLLTH
ncbi:IclR family transcriptional regulator [Bordetella genomosp. 13]|uniref:Transcriptional regulator n=1 Tax=Bordetella genomosp. 13 TaxID=463040 RepID=A0A1W6ZCC7_9BORD|nr:IclR family transcriptional regulator [Bordetella genomosp. 13]ARP94957.1 transcriptional regulator [Bordetella genomosp. 13]